MLNLPIIFILVLQSINFNLAEVKIYELHAYYFDSSPDGVKKQVLGINGQFPGPTIRAKVGDSLVVRVTNSIQDKQGERFNTSVHWHGIEQFLTPWYDGPEGVTQCPIPYGQSMEYRFRVYQTGSYWYHSHHSWQYVEGFWGLLIIDNADTPEVHPYHDELSISLTDWHHTPAKILSDTYHNIKPHVIPEPDTGLINGRGSYPCAEAMKRGFECNPAYQSPALLSVSPGKTYRIRVTNTAARSNFNFAIDGHKLYAIEVDGVDTHSVGPVDYVVIWPAQRYSFLVTMDGNLNEYWIRANMSAINLSVPGIEHPKAILKYERDECPKSNSLSSISFGSESITQGRPERYPVDWSEIIGTPVTATTASASHSLLVERPGEDYVFPTTPPTIDTTRGKAADEKHMMTLASVRRPMTTPVRNPKELDPNLCRPIRSPDGDSAPSHYSQLIVLNATFDTAGPTIEGKINGVAYKVNSPPVMMRMVRNQPIDPTSNPFYTPFEEEFRVVQVIINNNNGGSHPWHLHGHTFWVLGTGEPDSGPYVESRDARKLNIHGVRRETTHTFRNSWVVIRYRLYNPGAWLLHCHINWHLEIGLGAVFIEAEYEFRRHLAVQYPARQVCIQNGIDLK